MAEFKQVNLGIHFLKKNWLFRFDVRYPEGVRWYHKTHTPLHFVKVEQMGKISWAKTGPVWLEKVS